jgi:hypothetical protein
LLTARGTGQLNLNTAPVELLMAIPGMTSEAVEVVHGFRLVGRPVNSVDDLIRRLSPPARVALLERYGEFIHEAAFQATRFVLVAEGGIRGSSIVSRGWLTVVPTAGRLAVIRREME